MRMAAYTGKREPTATALGPDRQRPPLARDRVPTMHAGLHKTGLLTEGLRPAVRTQQHGSRGVITKQRCVYY